MKTYEIYFNYHPAEDRFLSRKDLIADNLNQAAIQIKDLISNGIKTWVCNKSNIGDSAMFNHREN